MTSIIQRDLVLAPLASADHLLQAVFAADAAATCGASRLVLRLGVATPPLNVAFERLPRPDATTPRYQIHWEDSSRGAGGQFDGELIVDAGVDDRQFDLVLSGEYVSATRSSGQPVDATKGRHVAQNAARRLLRELRVEFEALSSFQERPRSA